MATTNGMDTDVQEHIVMTPRRREPGCTSLLVERRRVTKGKEHQGDVHVAGGAHQGLVINKSAADEVLSPAQVALQFRVYLVSAQSGRHCSENRALRFWCSCPEEQQASLAQEFFKQLVTPNEFPRDYVGFIKRVMKLLQNGFQGLDKIEVEMRQLGETNEPPPERPLSADESTLGRVVELTEERLVEVIEAAYPNPISLTELARERGWDEESLAEMLAGLQQRGVVSAVPDQPGTFTRAPHGDTDVQVVRSMPKVVGAKQPTIAVVTSLYCEKLAVDAMMTDTETYVRYTTVGESNVYTLGTLGSHRVVTTKLPTSGHTREAMTAAGNTTTRLLGTFQQVESVFLVGVGGGVPHYTDEAKHVRLGDVVISSPSAPPKDYVYVYCDSLKSPEEEGASRFEFETKHWSPPSLSLQQLAEAIKQQSDEGEPEWLAYLNSAQEALAAGSGDPESAADFSRPAAASDKLYMNIGSHDVIEVEHPTPAEGAPARMEGCPRLHLGPVASGRLVARDEECRHQFVTRTGAIAFDPQLDAAVQSVQGNCRDAFIAIRGISDYRDGSRRSEWQPYAALAAASVMRSIICAMEPPSL